MFFKFIASSINAGAIAMIAGLIIVPVVSVLTPKMDKKKVDDIFACYDEEVPVKHKLALSEKED
jgi:SSS family solute:Na+ symporter